MRKLIEINLLLKFYFSFLNVLEGPHSDRIGAFLVNERSEENKCKKFSWPRCHCRLLSLVTS